MNLRKELDLAIKASERGSDGGYEADGRVYPAYMTNAEWNAFLDEMSDKAKKEYGAGGGGELIEKNGRPPKMASYGSSSRMIYRLSRDTEGFCFEKKLPTSVGGSANLDGYLEQEDRHVFVEAKCREPYHKPYDESPDRIRSVYRKLYEYISENSYGELTCDIRSDDGRDMEVVFGRYGEVIKYLDVKQLICHLLGIGTALLNGSLSKKRIEMMYLVYDPTELQLKPEAKEGISAIYETLREECASLEMSMLFTLILTYLRDIVGIGDMSDDEIELQGYNFTFYLCDQELYPTLLV